MDSEPSVVVDYKKYIAGKYGDKVYLSQLQQRDGLSYPSRMQELYPQPIQVAFLDAYAHYVSLLTAAFECVEYYPRLTANGLVRRIFPMSLNAIMISPYAHNGDTILQLHPNVLPDFMQSFNLAKFELERYATQLSRKNTQTAEAAVRKKYQFGIMLRRFLGISDERTDKFINDNTRYVSDGKVEVLRRGGNIFDDLSKTLPTGVTYGALLSNAGKFEMCFEPLDILPEVARNMRDAYRGAYHLEVI